MLSASNIDRIAAGCERFGIPVPKRAKSTGDTHAAAVALRDAIREEVEPSLDNLTPAGVKGLHERMVAYANRPARLAAADTIENRAAFDRAEAWSMAVPDLLEAFRAPFTGAASRFTKALDQLDGNTDAQWAVTNAKAATHAALTQAADDLAALAMIREAFATEAPTGILPREVDRDTRVLTVPSVDTVLRRIPIRADGHARHTLGWWAVVAKIDGVVLEWHTPREQLALTDHLPAEVKRTAAA